MANTALNRTVQFVGTNKSGGALVQGDVVILDNTTNNGFTTTTSGALSTRGIAVIIEPNGIANNASGMIASGGWVPKINLNTSATAGQFVKTHTVAGQGTPHASPQVEGDFAVVLDVTSATSPTAWLFGSPNPPSSGGAGTVTNTGTLTDHALILGNGGVDVGALGSLGTTTTVLHGNAAGDPTFGAVALETDVSGNLPFANLTQIAGLSVLGVTGSSTADVAAITAGTDNHVLTRVSSSSLAFALPGWVRLSQIVTASSQATVDFTSISASYSALKVLFQAKDTTAGNGVSTVRLKINNDGTSGNYTVTGRIGASNGASFVSVDAAAATGGSVGNITNAGTTSQVGQSEVTITSYAGTTFFKSIVSVWGNFSTTSNSQLGTSSFAWLSTSAINQLTFSCGTAFTDNSVFTLYGLK